MVHHMAAVASKGVNGLSSARTGLYFGGCNSDRSQSLRWTASRPTGARRNSSSLAVLPEVAFQRLL